MRSSNRHSTRLSAGIAPAVIAPAVIALAITALAILALGSTAAAEVLVLEDGSSVETRGPWRVKGRMVIFHLPNGTLSSLRLDTVDLDASEAIRRQVRVAEPLARVATSALPRPVLVVTDRDVKRAAPPPATPVVEEEPVAAPSARGRDAVVIAARDLEIGAFEIIQDPRGGLEVTGVLHNRGERIVTNAQVLMTLPATGDSERTYEAIVSNEVLAAGGRSWFRILLPDVFAVERSDLSFALHGKAVRPRIVRAAPTGSAGDDGEASSGVRH